MKVLITGGTGFLGSYIVPELLTKNIQCRLLVRNAVSAKKRMDDKIELVEGDITKPETLQGLSEDITHVLHMAALGHVSAISKKSFRDFVNVNVNGTKNLLRACANKRIKRFVHISSTAAMGLVKKKGPVDETDKPQPITPYQQSKLQSEQKAFREGRRLGIPVVVIRPCMIYGKGGRGEFFKIADMMRKGIFPKVGVGRNLTPLVHASDVTRAVESALFQGKPGETYLIASSRSLPMDELRSLIMKSWNTSSFYPFVPTYIMYTVAWLFEQLSRVTGIAPPATRQNIANTVWDREFSIKKAAHDLGYEPQDDFGKNIHETIVWYQETDSNKR